MCKSVRLICFFLVCFSFSLQSQVYSEQDKQGLRELIRQQVLLRTPTYFPFNELTGSDTLNWDKPGVEDWVKKVEGVIWSDSVPKRLIQIQFLPLRGTLNCKMFPELKRIELVDSSVSELILSENKKLEVFISMNTQLLRKIDVAGLPALVLFYCQGSDLDKIDLSNCPKLENVNLYTKGNGLSNVQLKELNLLNTPQLQRLFVERTQLSTLDLSTSPNLTYCYVNDNKLETIKFTSLTKIISGNVRGNMLKFSQLAPLMYDLSGERIKYNSQNDIYGGTISSTAEIDLSSEYEIRGNLTKFEWYDENDSVVAMTDKGRGVFVAGKALEGKALICRMTHKGMDINYVVDILSVTGIGDVETSSRKTVSIYPNPVSNTLFIESENAVNTLELFNTSGVLVKKITGTMLDQMDVTDQPRGIYFLRATSDKGRVTLKVHKK